MSDNIGQSLTVVGNVITNSNMNFYQIQNASSERSIINDLDFEMPTLSKYGLVGRELDIEFIFDKLKSSGRVAILGMGGLGKTTLAIYCAKTWQTKFGNTAFLTVDNRQNFESCTKKLASKLKINKEQAIIEIWKNMKKLYSSNNKKLLVILDNLDNLIDIEEILGLEPNNLYFLVTTQNVDVDEHFFCFNLDLLTQKDGIDLILSIMSHNFEKDDEKVREQFLSVLRNLYDVIEGLPLALVHSAYWVVQTMKDRMRIGKLEKTTNSYISLIKEYLATFKQRLEEDFPKQYATKTSKSAFLVLALNIEKLSYTESKKLLFLLGYLNPIEIKFKMFKGLFNDNVFESSLVEISKYSLIYIENVKDVLKSEVTLIRIHRVVQDVVRIYLKKFESNLTLLLIRILCEDNLCFRHLDNMVNRIKEDSNLSYLLELCSKKDLELTINKIFDLHPNSDLTIKNMQNAGCNIRDKNWPIPHKVVSMITPLLKDKVFTAILNKIFQIFDDSPSVIGDGITLQHVAASNINTSYGNIYKFLQKEGVDIHKTTLRGVSPLNIAAVATKSWDMNDIDIEQIISLGVSVYLTDIDKNTPLHHAAKWGKISSVNALLSLANVKKYVDLQNNQGKTSLYLAVAGGFNKEMFGGNPVLSLLESGAQYDFTFQNGENLLHKSVRSGSLSVVKFICSRKKSNGSKVNAVDNDGNTAAHLVVNPKDLDGIFENSLELLDYIQKVMSILIEAGANFKLKNHAGLSVLDVAAKNCLDQVIESIYK